MSKTSIYIYTHTHTYIYIYVHIASLARCPSLWRLDSSAAGLSHFKQGWMRPWESLGCSVFLGS